MVERRTPKREVGSRNLPPCCVLEQDTLLSESTGIPREQWLRPGMTEKLLTWTLNLKKNKDKKIVELPLTKASAACKKMQVLVLKVRY